MKFELVSDIDCLFLSQDTHVLLFFFIDDIVVLHVRRYISQVNDFQVKLFKRFEMKCLKELK
jgi:hypothetical protein